MFTSNDKKLAKAMGVFQKAKTELENLLGSLNSQVEANLEEQIKIDQLKHDKELELSDLYTFEKNVQNKLKKVSEFV